MSTEIYCTGEITIKVDKMAFGVHDLLKNWIIVYLILDQLKEVKNKTS
jgi:hypothetical protein